MPSQLPPATSPVWTKLATGQITRKFSLFAANMAVSQASRRVAANPSETRTLAAELHGFFKRYEALTAADIAAIA